MSTSDDRTREIRAEIERTRGDMSRTVDAIEERLSPAHIKEQVANVKESVLGNYHEAKDHVKEDIVRELREAKEKVQGEILETKDKVMNEIRGARTAVHDATVGRVQHMVHDARETVTDAGTTVLDVIKANPIPTALVAVGLGWLLMGARRSGGREVTRGYARDRYALPEHSYGYTGERESFDARPVRQRGMAGNAYHAAEQGVSRFGARVQEGAQGLASHAGGVAHDVSEKAGAIAHEVGDKVSHLAHEAVAGVEHVAGDVRMRSRQMVRGAGRQMRRAERTFESTLRENPLAMGAAAVAVGATIGLLIPHTGPEDQWVGPVKDKLIGRARELAGDALSTVEQKVAGELGSGSESDTKQDASTKEKHSSASNATSEPKNGLSNGLSGTHARPRSPSI